MNSTLHTIDFVFSSKIVLHILSINCAVSRLLFFVWVETICRVIAGTEPCLVIKLLKEKARDF